MSRNFKKTNDVDGRLMMADVEIKKLQKESATKDVEILKLENQNKVTLMERNIVLACAVVALIVCTLIAYRSGQTGSTTMTQTQNVNTDAQIEKEVEGEQND